MSWNEMMMQCQQRQQDQQRGKQSLSLWQVTLKVRTVNMRLKYQELRCHWRIVHCPTLWHRLNVKGGQDTAGSKWQRCCREIKMMASHDEEHFLVGYTKCVGVLKTVNEKLTAHIKWYLSEMIKAEIGENNLNHTSSFWKIKTTKNS